MKTHHKKNRQTAPSKTGTTTIRKATTGSNILSRYPNDRGTTKKPTPIRNQERETAWGCSLHETLSDTSAR